MDQQDKPPPSRPKVTFSRTLKDGKIESVELPAPSSMTDRRFVTLTTGDLATDQDVAAAMLKMFGEPEVSVEYYSEYQQPIDQPLKAAIDRGDILVLKTENYYYKHPRHERVYLLVSTEKSELPKWMQELVDKGPSFVKKTLALSERKKREYEIWQKIEMEEAFREELRATKYSYDVFLSYSENDYMIASDICDKLRNAGARVFMALKLLIPGDNFAEEIRQALRGSAEVWVIVSPNSLNSEWVTTEWGAAWVLDKKTVPILHRCDIPQLPDRLKSLHCVDVEGVAEMIRKKFTQSHRNES